MDHIEYLKSLEACSAAVQWASQYIDLATAWDNCHRSDWMLWLNCEADLLDDRTRRLLACAFVRRTPLGDGRTLWDLLDDKGRNAIEVAERYANGDATDEESDAVRAAADAAVRYATRSVESAARAAVGGATWGAKWEAAWDAALAAQADIIREIAGNPFRKDHP